MKQPPKHEYHRNLPHILKPDAPHFVTFRTRDDFRISEPARTMVFDHCLHDHMKRLFMHAFVVMPTHVHLLFTPLRDELNDSFTLSEIMQGIKGTSARNVNLLLDLRGSLWQDESLDHVAAGLARTPQAYRWLWVNDAQPGEAVPHHFKKASD